MVLYEPATSVVATAVATKLPSLMSPISWTAPTRINNTVCRGDTLRCSGKLTDAETGVGLAGRTIRIMHAMPQFFPDLFSVVTGVDGSYTFSIGTSTVAGATVSRRIRFDGDDKYNASETSYTTTSEARIPNLTISMPASGMPGENIAWSGKMVDPKVPTYGIPNKEIYLQQSPDEVTWTDVAGPIITGADGSHSGPYVLPLIIGTYYYRSRFPGGSPGAQHGVAVSKVVAVRVLAPKEAPPPEYAPPPITIPPIFRPPEEVPPEVAPKNLDELLWGMFVELLKALGLPVPPKPLIPLVPPLPLPEGE